MPDRCPYCTRPMDGRRSVHATYPTADHVIPQSLGGTRTILVCRRCNMDKRDMPIQVWQALLDRRKDPRAWHVSAFICANPWAVASVLLAGSALPRRSYLPVPRDRVAFDAEPLKRNRPWRCVDCGAVFYARASAEQHWSKVHAECEAL